MMCRAGHLRQCDNCAERFQRIAEAIDGKVGFTGVPNFDDIDIIVAQELFVTEETMELLEPVHQALARKGFKVYSPETVAGAYEDSLSKAARPTPRDPLCFGRPPWQDILVDKIRIPLNGGLVTWSKLPFVEMMARRW